MPKMLQKTKILLPLLAAVLIIISAPGGYKLTHTDHRQRNIGTHHLAAESRIKAPAFRPRFALAQALLSPNGVNAYIAGQIEHQKSIDGKRWAARNVTTLPIEHPRLQGAIAWGNAEKTGIAIVRIPGLLAHTGQFMHIGLSGKEYGGDPVIYIDGSVFRRLSDRLVRHATDQIKQWELLRTSYLGIGRDEMRQWIIRHIDEPDTALAGTPYEGKTSAGIAREFAEHSFPIDVLYQEELPRFNIGHITTMVSMYGTAALAQDLLLPALAADIPPAWRVATLPSLPDDIAASLSLLAAVADPRSRAVANTLREDGGIGLDVLEGALRSENAEAPVTAETARLSADLLSALGILTAIPGADGRYRLSEMMRGETAFETQLRAEAARDVLSAHILLNAGAAGALHDHLIPAISTAREYLRMAASTEDTRPLTTDITDSAVDKGYAYEIRYDAGRLRAYQRAAGISEDYSPEQLIIEYMNMLKIRMDDLNRVTIIPSTSGTVAERDLIVIRCFTDRAKTTAVGEGHVNIKGDLEGQTLQMVDLLNMAFAASHIRTGVAYQDMDEREQRIVRFIKMVCKTMTGIEVADADILMFIRDLPRARPIPVQDLEAFYQFTIQQLLQSA